jgi:hypothetical protein
MHLQGIRLTYEEYSLMPGDLDYVKECVIAPIIPLEVTMTFFFLTYITPNYDDLDGRTSANC